MKVGDTVIRIKAPSSAIPVGTITTIKQVSKDLGSIRVSYTSGWYSIECFKIYKSESDNVINFLP